MPGLTKHFILYLILHMVLSKLTNGLLGTEGTAFLPSYEAESSPSPRHNFFINGVSTPFSIKTCDNSYEGDGNKLRIDNVSKDAARVYTSKAHIEIVSSEIGANIILEHAWRLMSTLCLLKSLPSLSKVNPTNLQMYIVAVIQRWIYTGFVYNSVHPVGGVTLNETVHAKEMIILESYMTAVVLKFIPSDDKHTLSAVEVNFTNGRKNEYPYSERITVQDLRPGTNYSIFVSLENENGMGSVSEFVIGTKPARKPYPIKVLSKSFSEGTSYNVFWEKQGEFDLQLIEYKISYRMVKVNSSGYIVNALEDWKAILTKDVSESSATLNQLEPNSYYQLEIYARNEIGWSEIHEEFVVKIGPSETDEESEGTLGIGAIIAMILIFLLAVDISCYYTQGTSILVTIYRKVFGKNENIESPGPIIPTGPASPTTSTSPIGQRSPSDLTSPATKT